MALELQFIVNDKATPEIKKLQTQLKQLQPVIKDTEKGFGGINKGLLDLGKAYIAFTAISSATQSFIKQADAMTNVNSKLKLVTASTEELKSAQEDLFKISQESRVAFTDTVDLYSRMARSTKDLGISQEELLKVTDTISKSLIVSGGSAESMNAALVQLGQGFASGTLRGEELNSVMEQTPRLAKAIADGMGIGIGKLREMAAEGKVTSKVVIDALKSQAGAINKEFSGMTITVDQSLTQIGNSLTSLVGNIDDASKATTSLSKTFSNFSNGLDIINAKLKDYADNVNNVHDVHKLSTIKDAERELKQLKEAYQKLQDEGVGLFQSTTNYNYELKQQEFLISSVERKIQRLKKAKEEQNRLEEESRGNTESTNSLSKSQIKLNERLAKEYIKITGSEYDVWLDDVNRKMELMAKKTGITTAELESYKSALMDTDPTLDDGEWEYENELEALREKNSLIQQGTDLLKSEKDIINEKYMSIENAVKDTWDTKKMKKFHQTWAKELQGVDKKQGDINKSTQNIGQIYSNISSLMGNFYDKDDRRKQRQQKLNQAINIANQAASTAWLITEEIKAIAAAKTAVAVSAQSSPWTGIATATAMIGLLGSIGIMLSGKGSGGGVAPEVDQEADKLEAFNTDTDLVLDKFDRQIALLESIDKNGTASKTALTASSVSFQASYEKVNLEVRKGLEENFNELGLLNSRFTDMYENLLKVITPEMLATGQTGRDDLVDWDYYYEKQRKFIEEVKPVALIGWYPTQYLPPLEDQEYAEILNNFQNELTEFAVTTIESINELVEVNKTLKSSYDDITGSARYATEDLENAYSKLDEVRGGNTIAEFIEKQIENISKLDGYLTKEKTSLLLSEDPNDLNRKIEVAREISEKTGVVFDNGAEDVLNFIDSIELVSETIKHSIDNVKEWEDSFKSSRQLALELGEAVGIGNLAGSLEELQMMFTILSGGVDGLTEAELDFLQANKKVVDSFTTSMAGFTKAIDDTIWAIQKSTLQSNELTTEEIRRLNETQRAFESSLAGGDSERAKELLNEINSLSRSIAGTSQSDNIEALNKNLITQLEENKALINFEDEILMVHIVGSDLTSPVTSTSTTPSVYVTNTQNNDDRLATLEAIMTEVLKTNRRVYDILARIENDGVKTI